MDISRTSPALSRYSTRAAPEPSEPDGLAGDGWERTLADAATMMARADVSRTACVRKCTATARRGRTGVSFLIWFLSWLLTWATIPPTLALRPAGAHDGSLVSGP